MCASPLYLAQHGVPAQLADLGWALDGKAFSCVPNGIWRSTSRADGRPSCCASTRTAFCRSPSADLFMYYSNRRNQSARAHSFIDFLIGCFADAR
jgi:DNA-binding transcriptional LysR family regulator